VVDFPYGFEKKMLENIGVSTEENYWRNRTIDDQALKVKFRVVSDGKTAYVKLVK